MRLTNRDVKLELLPYFSPMHSLQRQLLELARSQNLAGLTLREISMLLGRSHEHPQNIKHHLMQLEKKGLIRIDRFNDTITAIRPGTNEKKRGMYSIPVLGLAYCVTDLSVNERFQGYLTISEKILPSTARSRGQLFAFKAVGKSMNRAKVRSSKPINDGDYIIIDSSFKKPKSGEYVIAEIGGKYVAKKFFESGRGDEKCILLMSESDQEFPPIVADPNDFYEYMLQGKIIDVVRTPNPK